jgi:hypothetical protein
MEIFENFQGPNLKREEVVKGLVGKIMEGNPGYNEKIVFKVAITLNKKKQLSYLMNIFY